uniref:Uncharacterized protein n=1 Tax=viral metagenome TaxID=1070528 RepID=A0A6C0KTU0_9ZZZZ
MDSIYNEMFDRNIKYLNSNNFYFDNILGTLKDTRKCVAILNYDDFKYTNNWYNLKNNLDTILNKNTYIIPRLHNTFLIVDKWSLEPLESRMIDNGKYENIKEFIKKNIKHYNVVYNRIIPVKSGLTLCGTADIDINKLRDLLRNTGLVEGELYYLDIIHITILRFVKEISCEVKNKLLNYIISLPKQIYITHTVNNLRIVDCGYTVFPKEITEILSVKLI